MSRPRGWNLFDLADYSYAARRRARSATVTAADAVTPPAPAGVWFGADRTLTPRLLPRTGIVVYDAGR